MTQAILPSLSQKPTKILYADEGHPLPTKKGLQKTAKIIATAKQLTEKDLAIVLISGGGSAMFTQPTAPITLQEKITLTKKLLKSGADIQEINTIRKHISQVKGGRFAQLLYPATVWGFVISDVIGNDLSTIASGPISPDQTTAQQALEILKKHNISEPKSVINYLQTAEPNPAPKYFKKVHITIIADHQTVIEKAQEKAKQLKLKTIIFPTLLSGEARDTAKNFVKNFRKITRTQPTLLIASGETTVTCKGTGQGGRNQEFVLAALPHLQPNQTLLSIGTDGVDGICPIKVAGAIADQSTKTQAKRQNLDLEKFLHNNDSYTFFKKTSGHIKTGPTGTNLGDLVLLI